jgi:hypothetical protein
LEARLPSERLSFQPVEKASIRDSDAENLKQNETVAEQGVAKRGACNRTRLLQISTAASLNEMIAPGALVMLSPVVTGTLFGTKTLAGLLAGSLVSGVQVSEGFTPYDTCPPSSQFDRARKRLWDPSSGERRGLKIEPLGREGGFRS